MNQQQTPGSSSEAPKTRSKNLFSQDIKSIQLSNIIPQKQAIEKTSMNLYIREKDGNSLSIVLPTLIVIIVVVGLFAKFAVFDRLSALHELQNEESRLSAQLAEMNASLADYDQVRSDYRRYSGKYLDDAARSYVDRLEIFALLDRVVSENGTVSSIDITGNTVSVKLTASSLAEIAAMRSRLEAEPYVSSISVKTADRGASNSTQLPVTSALVFTVSIPEEEGAE